MEREYIVTLKKDVDYAKFNPRNDCANWRR